MIIRRETLEDRAAVDAVTSAAFGRPGVDGEPVETRLLRALRDDAGWISTLSMVAERDDEIIGHVVCTRGRVGILDALGLGPISVLPIRQRLVQEVVPADTQLDRTIELARAIAAEAPLGVQATLANARVARAAAAHAAVEHLREAVPSVLRSADASEGVRSFLERRAGHFTGE